MESSASQQPVGFADLTSSTRASFGTTQIVPIELPGSGKRRLNLYLSFLSRKWSYGGISTALRLMFSMAAQFDYVRIIVMHEQLSEFEAQFWSEWETEPLILADKNILFLGSPDSRVPLTLCSEDFFCATAWTSAFFCEYLLCRQNELFKCIGRQYIYFIQEYEPGFFQWSVDYANAESTYKDSRNFQAVINSAELDNFLQREGFYFATRYIYEPFAADPLRRAILRTDSLWLKERLIFVYARPTVARNGFDAIVQALKIWANTYHEPTLWSLISDGDPHPDIEIARGVILRSIGRANLEEYAEHLSRSWIGISLVFSPHPGYTVLEMAQFGSWTITNRWKNKDASLLSPNILTIEAPFPESIADRLAWACEQYVPNMRNVVSDIPPLLRLDGDEFPFVNEILDSWAIRPNRVRRC